MIRERIFPHYQEDMRQESIVILMVTLLVGQSPHLQEHLVAPSQDLTFPMKLQVFQEIIFQYSQEIVHQEFPAVFMVIMLVAILHQYLQEN